VTGKNGAHARQGQCSPDAGALVCPDATLQLLKAINRIEISAIGALFGKGRRFITSLIRVYKFAARVGA
jgi:hypothetical protein